MKKFIYLVAFFLLNVNLFAQQDVVYSVQAHQDDWELFWASKLVPDFTANKKVVFITLTAGDGGNGVSSFATAREKGSVYASKFINDLTGRTQNVVPTAVPTVVINGHTIRKYVYGTNVVNYFLNLPDGNITGTGFPGTGNKSLQKLYRNFTSNVSDINGLTTYTNWADLTATIAAIITTEKVTGQTHNLYTASLDSTGLNNGDHSDHIHTSIAAQAAVSALTWVGITEFIDYNSDFLNSFDPGNYPSLSNSDQENSAAIFGTYIFGMIEDGTSATFNFDATHKSWLPMDFFFVRRAPVGVAPVAHPSDSIPVSGKSVAVNKITIDLPLVIAISSAIKKGEPVKMYLSLYEKGTLVTSVYNKAGKLLFEQPTIIENNKQIVTVELKNTNLEPGDYIVKNVLNNIYTESRNISVR